MSQASLVSGHDALAFLANWDSCDFVLAGLAGKVEAEGSSTRATLRLPGVPGAAYFQRRQGKSELLHQYWSGLLEGMPTGYDGNLAVSCTRVRTQLGDSSGGGNVIQAFQ